MPLISRKVVQLHPTLRCNLSCRHCYSRSGPEANTRVSLTHLTAFLVELRRDGYEEVAISGGEPLLYTDLFDLVCYCSDLGFSVSVITNGMFAKKAGALLGTGHVAAISVSFDGLERSHDRMRRREGAFLKSLNTLKSLVRQKRMTNSKSQIGASVAVASDTIKEVPALTYKLAEAGADHVNLHPVSAVGRALASDITPLSETDYVRLALVWRALRQELPDTIVTADIYVPRAHQVAVAEGDLINPLVVTERGEVLPFTYGAPRITRCGQLGAEPIRYRYTKRMVEMVVRAVEELSGAEAGNLYGQIEGTLASVNDQYPDQERINRGLSA